MAVTGEVWIHGQPYRIERKPSLRWRVALWFKWHVLRRRTWPIGLKLRATNGETFTITGAPRDSVLVFDDPRSKR